MANIFDNTDLKDHENLTVIDDNKTIPNWIDQINAGGTVYDIATHHKITFKEGNTGEGVMWNGLTDLEIVIPTITDLVQNPVVLAGTVGPTSNEDKTGKISWTEGYGTTPKDGYLLFVTNACTFGGYTCEGGDMAVYANNKWNIVSGENQVEIVGANGVDKTFTIGSTEQSVLDVEGKKLKLKLADLKVSTGSSARPVEVESVTLYNQYIKLNKTTGDSIGKTYTFNNATTLASGKVTFTRGGSGLVTDIDFGSFDAGSLPSVVMSAKNIAISGGSLTASSGQDTGDFINSVSINKPGFFVSAEDTDTNKITMIDSITSVSGSKQFYTGITTTTSTSDADLTIAGIVSPTDGMSTRFIKGFANNATTVLTAFTPCSFTVADSSNVIATGFGTESSTRGDVVSDVTVSANNDTDVLNSATVSGHVLTFGSTKVASSVTTNCKYKNLNTTTYRFTPGSATQTSILTGGFTQASSVNYKFSKDNETVVSYTSKMWKIGDSALTVKKGSYTIDHTNMFANVSANTFVTYMSAGVLPSWQEGSITATTDIEAYVSTVLSTQTETIYGLESSNVAKDVYTLVSTSDSTDAVAVAAPQTISINASVDLTEYVTDVTYKS